MLVGMLVGKSIKYVVIMGLLASIALVARSNMSKLSQALPDGSANGMTITEVFAQNLDQIKRVISTAQVPQGLIPDQEDNGNQGDDGDEGDGE